MIEVEFSALSRLFINRRVPTIEKLVRETPFDDRTHRSTDQD
jgi:hypothetical protein